MIDEEEQVARAERRIAELSAQLALVDRDYRATSKQVRALLASRSWRLTAPVRRLRLWFSRPRGSRSPAAVPNRASRTAPTVPRIGSRPGQRPAKAASAGWRTYEDHLRALQAVALSERSEAAVELVARVATVGRFNFDRIRKAWEAGGVEALAQTCSHVPATIVLARIVANQQVEPRSGELAIALYERCLPDISTAPFQTYDHVLFVDLLHAAGRIDDAAAHLDRSGLERDSPQDWTCLQANLSHPSGGHSTERWLASLNRLFLDGGLEPVALKEGGGRLFDRLTCGGPAAVASGQPLVTVLMTTYKGGDATDQAIASVLAQTWRNLELIVVDDHSPAEYVARLEQWPLRDARVRFLRVERNVGTYAAKNLALASAKGVFVTCHDSDDWSHPRKIEIQVNHLLADHRRIGNFSNLARTDEDLRFVRFSNSGRFVYRNTSSLMFRREPVFEKIGYWDSARTGADTEYYKRIELTFDTRLETVRHEPLSFARTHDGALTHGSLGRGYVSADRRAYQSAWSEWHGRIRRGTSPFVDRNPTERKFAVPVSLLSEAPAPAMARPFKTVFVGDFCDTNLESGYVRRIWDVATREQTAICHVRGYAPESLANRFLSPAVQAMVNDGVVAQVSLEDTMSCEKVVLLTPTALRYIRRRASGISALSIEMDKSGNDQARAPLLDIARRTFHIAGAGGVAEQRKASRGQGSRPGLARPPAQPDRYWEQRKDELYYQVVRVLAAQMSADATSVIDVGSNKCPYLEWFVQVPTRTSIDLRRPYEAPGIRSIQADFLEWTPDQAYDIALCLQVLEHVPEAGAFAQKLLTLAPVVVVSVPYKWQPGRTKGHVHDPVDEEKMFTWFRRKPSYQYVCREVVSGLSRLIQVYEESGIEWESTRIRKRLLEARMQGGA